MKASHKEHKAIIGYQEIQLKPGQFVFGRKKAAQETGLSEKSIRTCLKNLKKSEKLTIKTANKYSILTVVNWELYQPKTDKRASRKASKGPARGQQGATYKNDKNEKDGNKKYSPEFLSFYEVYPRKAVKGRTWKAWKKLNPCPELQQRIMTALKGQLDAGNFQKPGPDGKDYRPYPSTWLNDEGWTNSLKESRGNHERSSQQGGTSKSLGSEKEKSSRQTGYPEALTVGGCATT